MNADMSIEENSERQSAMHPQKFAVWLFIVSVIMIFAALTSAYIVRKGDGNWMEFDLPPVLWVSTFVLLASSGTLHWAYLSAKKDNLEYVKIATIITTALGVLFLVLQLDAWGKLVENHVWFSGPSSNPAGSFLYVLTGLHGIHLVGGIIFLIIVLISSFKRKIHSKNLTLLEMCSTFWHFLDGLWIYLFLFLLLNN